MRPAVELLILSMVLTSLTGCITTRSLELPSRDLIQRGQLMIHSDFELPERHRLVEELTHLRLDIARILNVRPSDESINVYLFKDADRYDRYMAEHHPLLPTRRAFFIKSDTRLRVYAYWGEKVGEDLRHEVTHAYLHSAVPNLPLWLDEGLAEYFETGRGTHGVHPAHIDLLAQQMAQGHWQPDLTHLENMTAIGEMNQLAYAESWLWVHFLLEGPPTRTDSKAADLVSAQLRSLRDRGESEKIAHRLEQEIPNLRVSVIKHLETLNDLKTSTLDKRANIDVSSR